MNMEAAQQAFLNEARELLEEMESALLELESQADDPDLINAIFRAAHTIKGTSGVFGYEEVETFTHAVESVLDKVRAGELQIDSDLIATLLLARDHIGELVEIEVAAESLSDTVIAKGEQIKQTLEGALGTTSKPAEKKVAQDDKAAEEDAGTAGRAVDSDDWHLSVRFSPDVLRYGMDPASFIRYLSKQAEIKHVTTMLEGFPSALEMDPESCYLGYEISLATDLDKAGIEQVFEFVRDDCTLQILPPRSAVGKYLELIEALPEKDELIGEILVSSGALTRGELEEALEIQRQRRQCAEQSTQIGEVLVEQGMVHDQVVEAAAAKQQRQRGLQRQKTVRVDADKLDQLVNLVGELVIAGAGTNMIAQQLGNNELGESVSVVARLVEEIRDSALRLRMVQIGETFTRFQRVVRDVSRELGKDISLQIDGGDTELDKTVVEKIGDPLMHLVRNAMDHGIEAADARTAAGKPAQGTLHLNAYHDSGSIVIEVRDDGAGLDRERILQKALRNGLVQEGQPLSDREVYRLIFEPGFSTKEQVTNLSGRGVGMDVVKKNIESLRGSVDVESSPGKGTTVQIRLPLTLAIIDGFLVGVGDSSYVVPLDMVSECIELTDEERADARRQNHINLRGEVLPLLRLRDHFRVTDTVNNRENVVVVQSPGMKAGLVVDELLGEHQTVIKPLGKLFSSLKGLSGSTILGSGDVAVILDVPGLIQEVAGYTGYQAEASEDAAMAGRLH